MLVQPPVVPAEAADSFAAARTTEQPAAAQVVVLAEHGGFGSGDGGLLAKAPRMKRDGCVFGISRRGRPCGASSRRTHFVGAASKNAGTAEYVPHPQPLSLAYYPFQPRGCSCQCPVPADKPRTEPPILRGVDLSFLPLTELALPPSPTALLHVPPLCSLTSDTGPLRCASCCACSPFLSPLGRPVAPSPRVGRVSVHL